MKTGNSRPNKKDDLFSPYYQSKKKKNDINGSNETTSIKEGSLSDIVICPSTAPSPDLMPQIPGEISLCPDSPPKAPFPAPEPPRRHHTSGRPGQPSRAAPQARRNTKHL